MQLDDIRLPQRFWDKVQPEPNSGCWLWTACLCDGYGYIGFDRKSRRAHRVAYEALVGAIHEGRVLDHICRTRSCVNPAHLEPVTGGENIRRGETGKARGAQLRALTHCKQGHPYDAANTRWSRTRLGRLRRNCRTCHRSRHRGEN